MTLDNIMGITKGNTSTVTEQVKRFCRYEGIMCEYATDMGYCRITGCAKRHELYGTYKGGNSVSVEFIKKHLLSLPLSEAEWIPCGERMPDVGEILISDGNQVFIGEYHGNNTWSADGCDYDPMLENIAWMPLPEPYRKPDYSYEAEMVKRLRAYKPE